MQTFSCLAVLIFISNVAISTAWPQGLVEDPIIKVIEEPTYTIYLRYYDEESIEVYTRVYKQPVEVGKVIINAIHIRNEGKPSGGLLYENIYDDKYVKSLFFNHSKYSLTIDKFPNGKEAILVHRNKDKKLIVIIGKKESGEWNTENNDELNKLIRKYHPDLKP